MKSVLIEYFSKWKLNVHILSYMDAGHVPQVKNSNNLLVFTDHDFVSQGDTKVF